MPDGRPALRPCRGKLCRPTPAPDPKCMVKPGLSSGTTTGSCVITVNWQKRRFASTPSHHLTCCMRERFASTDICLLGSLLCGASTEAAPISSTLVLSTNLVLPSCAIPESPRRSSLAASRNSLHAASSFERCSPAAEDQAFCRKVRLGPTGKHSG